MIELLLKKKSYWIFVYLAMVMVVMIFGMDYILYILTDWLYLRAFKIFISISEQLGFPKDYQYFPLMLDVPSKTFVEYDTIYIYSQFPSNYHLPDKLFLFKTGMNGSSGPGFPSFIHFLWVTILQALDYYGGDNMSPYLDAVIKYTSTHEYSNLINKYEMFSVVLSGLWLSETLFKCTFGRYIHAQEVHHDEGKLRETNGSIVGIMQSVISLRMPHQGSDQRSCWVPYCFPLSLISLSIFWVWRILTFFPMLFVILPQMIFNVLFWIIEVCLRVTSVKKSLDTKSTEPETEELISKDD